MGLLLTDPGAALTGGPSIFISVSHSKSHAHFAFSGERKSAAQELHNPNQRTQPHDPHSQPRKEQPPQAQQEARQAHTKKDFFFKKKSQHSPHLRNGTEDLENFAVGLALLRSDTSSHFARLARTRNLQDGQRTQSRTGNSQHSGRLEKGG